MKDKQIRYAFWRSPSGEASEKEDSPGVGELLAEYARVCTVSGDGIASGEPLTVEVLQNALKARLIIRYPDKKRHLNETDAWSIVRRAIVDALKAADNPKAIQPAQVLSVADARAASFFQAETKDYVLVSSLSVDTMPLHPIQLRDCIISALVNTREFPYPPRLEKRCYDEETARNLTEAKSYKSVKIETRGRTIYEAVESAFEAVNLLRGLWTWLATCGSMTIRFADRPAPIGLIHVGPIHTLHHPDKTPVDDLYWFNPHPTPKSALFSPKHGWDELEKDRRWATERLASMSPQMEGTVEDLISRYAEALDLHDPDSALLRMWGILEGITGTQMEGADHTIQRAVWPLSDRELTRGLLQAVRIRRNLVAHLTGGTQGQELAVRLLKRVVDAHLLILIRNDLSIKSMSDYVHFLSMCSDPNMLEKQTHKLEAAAAFLRRGAEPSPSRVS